MIHDAQVKCCRFVLLMSAGVLPAHDLSASDKPGHTHTAIAGVCDAASQAGANLGAKINACVTALPTLGGVIQLPEGTSTFSTQVQVTKDNVTIRGFGRSVGSLEGATTMIWTGGASVLFTINANNVRLEQFEIGNTGSGTVAVKVVGGKDGITLDEMTILADTMHRFSTAAFQVPVGTPSDPSTTILLRRCWVQGAEIGVDIDNANNFVSDGSIIVYSRTNVRVGPTRKVFGFYFVNGSTAETMTRDSTPAAVNIDLISVNTAIITGDYFENVTGIVGVAANNQRTLRIGADAENVSFSGNYLNGQTLASYAITDSSNTRVTITNNTFNNYATAAVRTPGTPITVAYNNVLLGTTPIFTASANNYRLWPDIDQSQFGSATQRWTANLYAGIMYRSSGNTTVPDIVGNGTDPLVLGGKLDGSGEIRLGATTTFRSSADMHTKRIRATQGTALASANFTRAMWGNSSSFSAIAGTDQAFTVTVTAGGTGIAADPTVTLTFANGTWGTPPVYSCGMSGGSGTVAPVTWTPSATTLALTLRATPSAGSTYTFSCVGFGK
jgi:hypothetical protein